MPRVKSFRDLTLIEFDQENILVMACDSLGAIGPKEADRVAASGRIVGRCTVRVPLLEVTAAGAVPLVIFNTLSVEMNPTGKEILQGIHEELAVSGITNIVLNGSTEENVPVVQTGVGITVIGHATAATLRLGKARPGDAVYCLGHPLVGKEVLAAVLPDVPLVRQLLQQEWVHEVLPVGSKGVLYEARQLATAAGGVFQLATDSGLDVHKSAGPATCLLVAAEINKKEQLQALTALTVYQAGTIKSVIL